MYKIKIKGTITRIVPLILYCRLIEKTLCRHSLKILVQISVDANKEINR